MKLKFFTVWFPPRLPRFHGKHFISLAAAHRIQSSHESEFSRVCTKQSFNFSVFQSNLPTLHHRVLCCRCVMCYISARKNNGVRVGDKLLYDAALLWMFFSAAALKINAAAGAVWNRAHLHTRSTRDRNTQTNIAAFRLLWSFCALFRCFFIHHVRCQETRKPVFYLPNLPFLHNKK